MLGFAARISVAVEASTAPILGEGQYIRCKMKAFTANVRVRFPNRTASTTISVSKAMRLQAPYIPAISLSAVSRRGRSRAA